MAAAVASEPSASHAAAVQFLDPSAHQPYNFGFRDFLQREFRFGVEPDRPICEAFRKGHCPNENCPDKHYTKANYQNLICKHWLRGLCKKGAHCEFLHEYNLRAMPECIQYARYQLCGNGAECLYLHLDPIAKGPPCPHYERGFCPLGPACGARHAKRATICPHFLAGFCPDGPDCRRGAHPPWKEKDQLPKPKARVILSEAEEADRQDKARLQMEKDEEEDSKKYVDRGTYNQQKMQGRGRGGKRFRRGGGRGF